MDSRVNGASHSNNQADGACIHWLQNHKKEIVITLVVLAALAALVVGLLAVISNTTSFSAGGISEMGLIGGGVTGGIGLLILLALASYYLYKKWCCSRSGSDEGISSQGQTFHGGTGGGGGAALTGAGQGSATSFESVYSPYSQLTVYPVSTNQPTSSGHQSPFAFLNNTNSNNKTVPSGGNFTASSQQTNGTSSDPKIIKRKVMEEFKVTPSKEENYLRSIYHDFDEWCSATIDASDLETYEERLRLLFMSHRQFGSLTIQQLEFYSKISPNLLYRRIICFHKVYPNIEPTNSEHLTERDNLITVYTKKGEIVWEDLSPTLLGILSAKQLTQYLSIFSQTKKIEELFPTYTLFAEIYTNQRLAAINAIDPNLIKPLLSRFNGTLLKLWNDIQSRPSPVQGTPSAPPTAYTPIASRSMPGGGATTSNFSTTGFNPPPSQPQYKTTGNPPSSQPQYKTTGNPPSSQPQYKTTGNPPSFPAGGSTTSTPQGQSAPIASGFPDTDKGKDKMPPGPAPVTRTTSAASFTTQPVLDPDLIERQVMAEFKVTDEKRDAYLRKIYSDFDEFGRPWTSDDPKKIDTYADRLRLLYMPDDQFSALTIKQLEYCVTLDTELFYRRIICFHKTHPPFDTSSSKALSETDTLCSLYCTKGLHVCRNLPTSLLGILSSAQLGEYIKVHGLNSGQIAELFTTHTLSAKRYTTQRLAKLDSELIKPRLHIFNGTLLRLLPYYYFVDPSMPWDDIKDNQHKVRALFGIIQTKAGFIVDPHLTQEERKNISDIVDSITNDALFNSLARFLPPCALSLFSKTKLTHGFHWHLFLQPGFGAAMHSLDAYVLLNPSFPWEEVAKHPKEVADLFSNMKSDYKIQNVLYQIDFHSYILIAPHLDPEHLEHVRPINFKQKTFPWATLIQKKNGAFYMRLKVPAVTLAALPWAELLQCPGTKELFIVGNNSDEMKTKEILQSMEDNTIQYLINNRILNERDHNHLLKVEANVTFPQQA